MSLGVIKSITGRPHWWQRPKMSLDEVSSQLSDMAKYTEPVAYAIPSNALPSTGGLSNWFTIAEVTGLDGQTAQIDTDLTISVKAAGFEGYVIIKGITTNTDVLGGTNFVGDVKVASTGLVFVNGIRFTNTINRTFLQLRFYIPDVYKTVNIVGNDLLISIRQKNPVTVADYLWTILPSAVQENAENEGKLITANNISALRAGVITSPALMFSDASISGITPREVIGYHNTTYDIPASELPTVSGLSDWFTLAETTSITHLNGVHEIDMRLSFTIAPSGGDRSCLHIKGIFRNRTEFRGTITNQYYGWQGCINGIRFVTHNSPLRCALQVRFYIRSNFVGAKITANVGQSNYGDNYKILPIYKKESTFTSINEYAPNTTTFPYGVLVFGACHFVRDARPLTDNDTELGYPALRWKNIYLGSQPIVGSDARIKDRIAALDADRMLAFLNSLRPVSYEFTDTGKPPEERRTHFGFVAQEVEQTLYANGMNLLDFAGVTISPVTEECETGDYETSEITDENGETQTVKTPVMAQRIVDYDYGLRETELIAPIITVVQLHNEKISQQNELIKQLKDDIYKLTKRLDVLESQYCLQPSIPGI